MVSESLAGTPPQSFHLEWVERLSSGLDRLARGGINVVLLDLGLPDSQGLATLSAICMSEPRMPVVVLSGSEDELVALEAVQAGAQDYLVKAFVNRHVLGRALRYAIERKRADEAFRESEERLHLAMNAANEAIWELDLASGEVRWNDTYSRNFGRLAGEGSSSQWWVERIHPEDVERVTTSQDRALRGQGNSWEAEYRLLRADGTWADIQDRAIIARDPSGRPVRMVGAMLEITERKRAEEALQTANRQLRQLSSDLLRSQDYERRRIARELHDSTAQLLAALSINLSHLRDSGLEGDRRRQVLAETIDVATACSAEIRTITYLLHPPLLDQVGLTAALQGYAQGFNQRTGIQVEIGIPADFGRLSSEMESTLFRIVQEGLANVHKHSGSQSAVILLERDPHEVRLVLQDRGHGFLQALHPQAEGFVRFGVGILGMRERAEQLGGRLELSSDNAGTTLTVTLPMVYSHEEDTSIVGR